MNQAVTISDDSSSDDGNGENRYEIIRSPGNIIAISSSDEEVVFVKNENREWVKMEHESLVKDEHGSLDKENKPNIRSLTKKVTTLPTKISYHRNDCTLPIYELLLPMVNTTKKEKEDSISKTLEELTRSPPHPSLVCSAVPKFVKENKSFVVDTTKLKLESNLVADDCGSWIDNGKHRFHYTIDEEDLYIRTGRGLAMNTSDSSITLHRTYYSNKSASDFRRIISFVTDNIGNRLPLSKVEYVFEEQAHDFVIKSHGNNKKKDAPFSRTKPSTYQEIKASLKTKQPRIVLDEVSKNNGGIMKAKCASILPRNITQIYNANKDLNNEKGIVNTDPYNSLILMCKEQDKNSATAFVRKVECAPEPIVVLATDHQIYDVVKFCTHPVRFSVLQADPTFDLGEFSITTTQYEHLMLINRRSGKHPAMLGPMLMHQRKLKPTYKVLTEYLANKNPEFKKLAVIGTDGEINLAEAFTETCDDVMHLQCFIHFKNNIKDHLKKVGISEAEKILTMADLFGQQVGSYLEEGIVDSDHVLEYRTRLESLKDVWLTRLGQKGIELHEWFMTYKANIMETTMLRPIRTKAGLGSPPTQFVTNRVECINHLIKLETGKHSRPDAFVDNVKKLVDRQKEMVKYAIINKGPYKLHPSLSHMEMSDSVWFSLTEDEKEGYMESILAKELWNLDDALLDDTIPHIGEDELIDPLTASYSTVPPVSRVVPTSASTNGLDILASAVLSIQSEVPPIDQKSLDVSLEEFKGAYPTQSPAIIEGIYHKATKIINSNTLMTFAPGCDKYARRVASTRLNESHRVLRGKSKGDYKCDKLCPHWQGMKLCSHSVAAAQSNGELKFYLNRKRKSSKISVTPLVRTDMPLCPGSKFNTSSKRKKVAKIPIEQRVKKTYNSPNAPNTNPFVVKKMTNQISKCQGCRGSLRDGSDKIPPPPYDFCVSRMERRPYHDKTGILRTPAKESNAHYHLTLNCVSEDNPSFQAAFLEVPIDIGLTESHFSYIKKEFKK